MTLKEIKTRRKSVTNIKQITKAMQLVAASKMKKAQARSKQADDYALGALEILLNLTRGLGDNPEHPFWNINKKAKKVALVLVATERGFVGGMNTILFSRVIDFVKKSKAKGQEVDIITVGQKGARFADYTATCATRFCGRRHSQHPTRNTDNRNAARSKRSRLFEDSR